MTSDYKPDWPALMEETARATKELIEEAGQIAAAESLFPDMRVVSRGERKGDTVGPLCDDDPRKCGSQDR